MSREPVMHFRRAVQADAEMIRDFVRAAYAKWVPLLGREPGPMTADYEHTIREHRIDLLSADGSIVGLVETVAHPDHLWVENVAVRPDRQGEGLGKRLLAHAEHLAAKNGVTETRLLTNAAFESNIALYGRLGYRVDRRVYSDRGTAVYMSKMLR